MNEDGKQELRRLLSESLKHIHIEYRGKVFSIEEYRGINLYNGYDPSIRFDRTVLPDITDSSIKNEFLSFIRNELSEYIVDDKICPAVFQLKGGCVGHPLDDIPRSLLRIAIVRGVETAVRIFERTSEENYISFKWIGLLRGARVERELKVSDGIRLIPLPELATDLPGHLHLPIDSPSLTEQSFIGGTVLSMEYFITPAFCKPESYNLSLFQSKIIDREIGDLRLDEFGIDNFCMILSLACNRLMQPSIKWCFLKEDEILGEFNSTSSSYNSWMLDPAGKGVIITESKVSEARFLCGQLYNLESETREVLYIAMHRCVGAQLNLAPVDAMIDLGIAFESIYLDKNNTNQLSYTFRVRAAWYLGKNVEDRKHLMMTFKTLYDYRSRAVHTGKLPDSVKEGEKAIPIREFIDNAQDLCRQSIIKIIQDGKFPDWDSLVVGENAT